MWQLPGWDTTDKREAVTCFFESAIGFFFSQVTEEAPLCWVSFVAVSKEFLDRGSASSCTSLTTQVGLVYFEYR